MLPRRGALELLSAFDFADTCIQFFKTSENGVVEVNDRPCVKEVQFRELLVQTLDGWVLEIGLLVLDGFEVSLDVLKTLVDVVDVDFVHGWFGLVWLVLTCLNWQRNRGKVLLFAGSTTIFNFLRQPCKTGYRPLNERQMRCQFPCRGSVPAVGRLSDWL